MKRGLKEKGGAGDGTRAAPKGVVNEAGMQAEGSFGGLVRTMCRISVMGGVSS